MRKIHVQCPKCATGIQCVPPRSKKWRIQKKWSRRHYLRPNISISMVDKTTVKSDNWLLEVKNDEGISFVFPCFNVKVPDRNGVVFSEEAIESLKEQIIAHPPIITNKTFEILKREVRRGPFFGCTVPPLFPPSIMENGTDFLNLFGQPVFKAHTDIGIKQLFSVGVETRTPTMQQEIDTLMDNVIQDEIVKRATEVEL